MSFMESISSGHARERIEAGFGRWGAFSYRRRWPIILIFSLALGLLFTQLKHIHFDSSMEGFFHDDDPALIRYNEFRNQYGREDLIMVAVKTDEVFTLAFLEKFRRLHHQLEDAVPYLNEIDSLVNARHTLGVPDGIVVQDFLEDWPETEADVARLKQLALSNPMYVGRFVSEQSDIAVIFLKNQVYKNEAASDEDIFSGFEEASEPVEQELLSGIENHAIKTSIDEVMDAFRSDDFQIYAASGPYTTSTFMHTNRTNMGKYTLWAIGLVAFLLAVIFKRVVMVFLPLSVSVLSMFASLSIMAMMGIHMSFSMQIVPSFLMAVGVGNSVHVFTIFFQGMDAGKTKEQAIAYALQHSGLAITMTGLTTAGGLLSFLSSNMKPVAEFGAITPLGIMFALVFSLTLLPALIGVFPVRANKKQESQSQQISLVRRCLIACGNYSVANPVKVLSLWGVATVVGLLLAFTIRFSFFIYDQLPPDHYLIESVRLLDTKMSGASPLEIIVDTGREGGVKDPAFLQKVEQVYTLVENFSYNDHRYEKLVSIVDINRELHQALNENNPDFYRIPDDPMLVAQELLLFENSGSDDLEPLVDSQFRYARLSFTMQSIDGLKFKPFLAAFMQEFDQVMGGYQYKKTGLLDLTLNIFRELYHSMASTYIVAFMVITPLMIVLIGSLKHGLACMLPNLAPIIMSLGVMGALNIPMSTATLLVGSIAMGLVVDDTIHFMHNFQRYLHRHNDVRLAVEKTLETAGLAIAFTTMVLSSAFLVFMFNEVIEWSYFGLVTSVCIVIALLADITLAPALVALLNKDKVIKA